MPEVNDTDSADANLTTTKSRIEHDQSRPSSAVNVPVPSINTRPLTTPAFLPATLAPLRFEPVMKRIRWGGRKLGDVLGKPIGPENDYAESWEITDQETDQSVVIEGPLAGLTLQAVLALHNEDILGRNAGLEQFPLLIKFLDASDRLSVQVHPNDEQALAHDSFSNGKTEAWVIIDADPGSCVYSGLKEGVTQEILHEAIRNGTVEDCLHSIEVSPGDCIFIPAGTVHAIAEGILLAEVQQMSDLTFRLFDWNRTGADGRPRDLHVNESLACTDFTRGPVACVQPRLISGEDETDSSARVDELVLCEYFAIHRVTGVGKTTLPDDDRFHVLLGLKGTASVASSDDVHRLGLGETMLLPASRAATTLTLDDEAVVLDVFVP